MLLGTPFWLAVLIVLVVQGAVGFVGYELIHRLQAVLTRPTSAAICLRTRHLPESSAPHSPPLRSDCSSFKVSV